MKKNNNFSKIFQTDLSFLEINPEIFNWLDEKYNSYEEMRRDIKGVSFSSNSNFYQDFFEIVKNAKEKNLQEDITLKDLKNKIDEIISNQISLLKKKVKLFIEIESNNFSLFIGKNGVGKSRWLDSFDLVNNVVTRIESDRIVYPFNQNYQFKTLISSSSLIQKNEIYDKSLLSQKNQHYSLQYFSLNHSNISQYKESYILEYFDLIDDFAKTKLHNTSDKTKWDKVYENFDLINNDYELIENPFINKWMTYKIKNKNNKQLGIESLSFGEKNLMFILIKSITAPKNSFIFIDEPDIGLNEEKIISFLNKLKGRRSDLKFVFISHSEKLARKLMGEKGAKIYWIKEVYASGKNKNEIKYFDITNCDIDLSLYFSIICNSNVKKNILIVEGEENSIDNYLYKKVLSNFFIIPSKSNSDVEKILEFINDKKNKSIFENYNVYGLIDSDNNSIKSNSKNLFKTKLRKIEDIFYDKDFVARFFERRVKEGEIKKSVAKTWEQKILNVSPKATNKRNKKIYDKLIGYDINTIYIIRNLSEEEVSLIQEKLIPEELLKINRKNGN